MSVAPRVFLFATPLVGQGYRLWLRQHKPQPHLPLVGRSNRCSAQREAVRVGGYIRTEAICDCPALVAVPIGAQLT